MPKITEFLEEEIMCKDTESAKKIKKEYAEATVGKAFFDNRAEKRDLLKQDLAEIDHFSLVDIDSNPLKTYMGMEVTDELPPRLSRVRLWAVVSQSG